MNATQTREIFCLPHSTSPPHGPFVEYNTGDSPETVDGELPHNWRADYSAAIDHKPGRLRAPLVQIVDSEELAEAVAKASKEWVGIDITWDNAPDSLFVHLCEVVSTGNTPTERVRGLASAKAVAGNPHRYGGHFFRDSGSRLAGEWIAKWDALCADVFALEYIGDARLASFIVPRAAAIVDGQDEMVHQDATRARALGELVVDRALEGQWEEAVRLATKASNIEGAYGQSRAWAPVLALVCKAVRQ